jgi:hypothetical protein
LAISAGVLTYSLIRQKDYILLTLTLLKNT